MALPKDMDGNVLSVNTRVAVAKNIHGRGVKIKVGKIVGYTEKRVVIDFGEINCRSKNPDSIIKVFNQE